MRVECVWETCGRRVGCAWGARGTRVGCVWDAVGRRVCFEGSGDSHQPKSAAATARGRRRARRARRLHRIRRDPARSTRRPRHVCLMEFLSHWGRDATTRRLRHVQLMRHVQCRRPPARRGGRRRRISWWRLPGARDVLDGGVDILRRISCRLTRLAGVVGVTVSGASTERIAGHLRGGIQGWAAVDVGCGGGCWCGCAVGERLRVWGWVLVWMCCG